MTEKLIKQASFRYAQRVSFVGGEGIVRSFKPESGSWIYLVEMALGRKPAFGRVGAETMVLLSEAELQAL